MAQSHNPQPDVASPDLLSESADVARPAEYVVVARRYRPQTFDELIGQEHVARALKNAVATQRVGHAYLFTGARGVGKTSAARILAKALNCQQGPTPTPCNRCDVCLSIGLGNDIDVLEIDGASNRGIDEIRQLRQNVNVRPSRARFKIYIIDEVHMLTREAFNALLKTLEEPPEHVKFVFCTTEPTKIPITILSRCQRFDFAGIRPPSIAERLRQIVEAEGVTAEPAALEMLARRANGSMRDSQSLLEQLLAFGNKHITAADVHAMLGTAGDVRLARIVGYLVARDSAAALNEVDEAIAEGVEVGQLLEQLLGYFRDCMAAAVGCPADQMLYTSPQDAAAMRESGQKLGLETILAILQIVDQTLARLRYSTQGRTLAEMALVRISSLENLEELADVVAQLREASAGAVPDPVTNSPAPESSVAAAKKKAELDRAEPAAPIVAPAPRLAASCCPLTPETAPSAWQQAIATLSGLLADNASLGEASLSAAAPGAVSLAAPSAIPAPKRLVVTFPPKYTSCKAFCERPDQRARLEHALAEVTGQPVTMEFELAAAPSDLDAAQVATSARRSGSHRQRLVDAAEHPMVRRAAELFGARPIRVEEPKGS